MKSFDPIFHPDEPSQTSLIRNIVPPPPSTAMFGPPGNLTVPLPFPCPGPDRGYPAHTNGDGGCGQDVGGGPGRGKKKRCQREKKNPIRLASVGGGAAGGTIAVRWAHKIRFPIHWSFRPLPFGGEGRTGTTQGVVGVKTRGGGPAWTNPRGGGVPGVPGDQKLGVNFFSKLKHPR